MKFLVDIDNLLFCSEKVTSYFLVIPTFMVGKCLQNIFYSLLEYYHIV